MADKITNLYNAFLKSGYAMEPEADFRENLKDPKKRKAAYDALVNDGYNMEPYAEFESNIGYGKEKQPTPGYQPTSTGTAEASGEKQTPGDKPAGARAAQGQAQGGWRPSAVQLRALGDRMSGINAGWDNAGNESRKRLDRVAKGNRPGATMGEHELNARTGNMDKSYHTSTGAEVATPMEQSRVNTAHRQWWEDNTEEGQRSKELRLQGEFEDSLSTFWSRHGRAEVENAAELAWSAAEERQKSSMETNAGDIYKSRGNALADAALLGGRENHIMNAADNSNRNMAAHYTNFDLDRMMNESWDNLGEDGQKALIDDCYQMLSRRYPGADELDLYDEAKKMARQQSDLRLYNLAVKKNMPKGRLDYLVRQIGDMNMVMNISRGLAVSKSGKTGDMAAYEQANEAYRQDGHKVLGVAGTVAGFALDPTVMMTGSIGGAVGKGVMMAGGRQYASTMLGRIAGGMAGGMVNLGLYEGAKELEGQFAHGGHVEGQDESGRYVINGYSGDAVVDQMLHGALMGSAIGWLGPVAGNVSDKLVRGGGKLLGKEMPGISNTYGKAVARAGVYSGATILEGTIFSVPEWIKGKGDPVDVWTDNMAMMIGFKGKHILKSAGGVLSDLSASFGRTADGSKSRLSFESQLRMRMDALSDGGMALTKDERAELDKYGYGDLQELMRDVEAGDGESAPKIVGRLRDMVNDTRVSEAARAKMYYYATGHRIAPSTVMRGELFEDGNGGYTVESQGANGVITSRTFSSRKAADLELERINRQVELNSIEIGERYRQAEDSQNRLKDACRKVATAHGWDAVGIYRICEDARGGKELDDSQKGILNEVIEAMGEYDATRVTDEIRGRINEKYGVDIDDAIRKEPKRRTEEEQAALDEYISELFPEKGQGNRPVEDVEAQEYEESEADRKYEEGRLLYGRMEEGDTATGAEVDAIVLRMQEARQLCEEAFGDEAEVFMSELEDDPWGLLENPELTPEQKDTALYYINAKAALDGVKDASEDAAERKRQQVAQEVAHRTHRQRGVIVPAVMKANDEPVYIISGDVVMFADGSGVDVARTEKKNPTGVIYVLDASGEYKPVSANQLKGVGEAIDPETELREAWDAISREHEAIAGGGLSPDDKPADAEGSADGPLAEARGLNKKAESGVQGQAAGGTVNVEYNRGYDNGIMSAQEYSDERLNSEIENLRENFILNDFGRGTLAAYEHEQQRRAKEGSQEGNNAGQNIPEEPVGPENVEEYDRGYEESLERSRDFSDERLAKEIEDLRGEGVELTDYGRGMLEAYEYEQQERTLKEGKNVVTSRHGEGFEQDNGNALQTGAAAGNDGGRMAGDAAGIVEGDRDRSDIRVYEEGLGASRDEHSEYSERTRRDAEAERLIGIARENGQYLDRNEVLSRGRRHGKGTGESEVSIDQEKDRVYKVKNPYAKSPMKGNVQPEDAIYEHLVHNKYFPETRYQFEGISDDMGDLRIVLSQDFVEAADNASDEQIEAALAEKGLYPEGTYSYGNDEITVTDVTGDNALLGADGKVYFIDPIINFKKPVREILGDGARGEAPTQGQRRGLRGAEAKAELLNGTASRGHRGPAAEPSALERVPRDEKGKPRFERAESPEAGWDALVEHHKGDAAKAKVTAGIMVENTRKALEKARKLKPKGNDPDEILASQEAIEAQLAEAQHAHEFWQKMAGVEDAREAVRQEAEKAAEEQRLAREREEAEKAAEEERRWKEQKSKLDKRLRATAEKYRDIPEVMELLGHMEPMSADEVAAWLLSRHKVLWKSTEGASGMVIKAGVGYHVGIGEGERRKLFGLFASEAKGGVSIERLAEDLFKEACEEFGVPYDNQEALTALIDMIRGAYTMGDIRNYIANKRIADAEKMGGYVRAREDEEADAYYREAYGMSREEYEAREEQMVEQARDFAENFDEQEFFRNIADDIINRQRQEDEYRRNQAAVASGEGAAGGRGGEVLSPPQSAQAGRYKGAAGEATRSGRRDRAAQHHQDGDLAGGTPGDAGLSGAERRSGALTEAEVVKYEAHVKSQLEDYVNNGIRESDAIQMLRKDIYRHETVYLSAGYSPEEAQAKATKLVDDIISKLTPKKVGGFTIYIENERGNVRRGVDEDDNVWETEMRNDYGFISDAKSTDGDNIDVFLSADIDGWDGRKVYVVDQYNPDGTFDEHKVMLGFNSKEEAFAAYLSNYEKGWEKGRRLDCTEVNIEDFEKWVESSHRKTKAFAEYKSVKTGAEGKDAREGISPDDKPADAEGTDDGPLAEARGLDKKAGADAERHPGDGVGGAVPQAYRTMHEADWALTDHMRGMELGDLEKNEENLAAMTRLHEEYHQRIDEYADALTGMSDAQAEKAADDAPLVEDILRRAMQFGYRDETRRKFEDVKRRIDGILANRLLGEAYTKSPEMAEAGRKAGKFKVSEVSDKKGDASGAYSGVNHHGEDKVAVASNGRMMVVSEADYDQRHAGRKVDAKGNDIGEATLKPWRKVLESRSPVVVTKSLRESEASRLSATLRGIPAKERGDKRVVVALGRGQYRVFGARDLELFLRSAQHVGAKEIEFLADGKARATGDKGAAIILGMDALKTDGSLEDGADMRLDMSRGVALHAGREGEAGGSRQVYDAAKGLVESTGLEVVEVSDEEAQAMLEGNKKTPVAGQPNRANEKPTSGSVLLSISGNSSSNRAASKESDAKLRNRTQSAKRKISQFTNGDYSIDTRDSTKAIQGLGKLFGMDTKGGSRYTILRTDGGRTVAVRLSDHGANGNNFRQDGADRNLSIVIERRKYDTPDSEIEFTEVTIPESTFRERPQDVVSAIVKGVEDVLADGEFTLDSSLGRVEKRGARYLKDGAGRVYGWTDGKRICLNRDAMNPETPVHEYTHLWDDMVRRENPELWARGKELMKQTPMWDEVMNDPNYADIRDDEDAVASEVHSRLTGERGAEILEEMIDKAEKKGAMATAEAVTLVERIKAWLGEMFRALRKTLGKWSGRDLEELTAEDFVNLTLRDLAEGMNPLAEAEGPLAEARGLDKKSGSRTRYNAAMARGKEDFATVREKAAAERGSVMPGLREAEVKVVDVPRHEFAGSGREALQSAEKWAKENITGTHTATDSLGIEFEYSISNDTVEKYVSKSSTAKSENIGVHLAALKKLPEIIRESLEAEVHPDYKKRGGKRGVENDINSETLIHRFYGAINIDGKIFRVKTTMREYQDPNTLAIAHSYEVTQIELLEAPFDNAESTVEPLAMTSNSSIPVAKLLKDVEKSYDPGKKLLEESAEGATEAGDRPVRYHRGKRGGTKSGQPGLFGEGGQPSLFDEEELRPRVRIKAEAGVSAGDRQTPGDKPADAEARGKESAEEAEAARRAEVANGAIDRYAERHESIRQSYGELIERAREAGNEALAEGLEERMYSEQQAATEELELELTDYYQSEGNSGTDASRMASDMSARVRADIRLRRRGYFPQQARGKGQETRGEGQESTVVTAGGERIEFRTEKAREGSGLPRLKEGEFTLVERTFTETGEFGFTGKDRIETADDVAYIFRSLENYSVENTFAVLVKDGRPLIVHTGMGTATMSPMDMAALRGTYDEYGADEVYMVHNHPSGSLKASMEDARLLKTVTGMFAPGTVKDGIIIDVTSGRYCTFDTSGRSAEATSSRPAGEVPHPARRFDGRNRELKAEFDKTEPTIIRGSGDVAGYVAGKRLGGGSKISMLLLSQRGQVTGNIITGHEAYAGNEEAIAGEMARLGTRYGARRVIPYGNAELSRESVTKLAAEVKRLTGGSLEVIDALQITNGLGGYVSAQDSYMMEGAAAYGKREAEKAEMETPEADQESEGLRFRIRDDEPPKQTGVGYKVFVLKDGKLYPPMVANPNGEATPVGVWLDADQAPIAGTSKTGRMQVKAGGKGTQGGSGKLAYRPGWHLGVIPYALQFNRKGESGEKELFPANFVWAEVEYADDIDYQEEAMSYGYNKNGNFQHSYAGLPRIPINGAYKYRTNPNPETDPWIITGAIKVNRLLTPSEVDDMVKAAGREPQKRQDGAVTDEQINELNSQLEQRERQVDGGQQTNEADPWKAAWGETSRTKQRQERRAEKKREAMRERVGKLSAILGVEIEVIEDGSALEGRKKKAKGWYDSETGQITIVADNHRNAGDIADTAVHEAVGHHGLRQLFGTEERLNNFLDEAYNISSDRIKAEIDRRTQRMMYDEADRLRETMRKEHEARGENPDSEYYADMAKARVEAEKQREQIRRDATEEYAADLGMKIGEEGFERMDAEELTFWGKIKGLLQRALDRLLAGMGLPRMRRWTDKEWSYVLWRSWRNLREGKSSLRSAHNAGPLAEAEDIVMRERMLFNADPLMEKTPKRERIAKLRRSKPVEITGEEFEYSEDLKQHKKNALEYGKRLQGEYQNEDTGKTIQLQRGRRNGGLKEVLQHDLSDAAHIKSVAAIPDIIRKSIYIETEPNHDKEKNPDVEGYEHYVCGLKIGGEDYTVHSIVAEDRQGDRYYDHKLSRIEKGRLLDFIEAKQPVEGILTPTSGTEPTIRSERKVKELISILQISDAEKRYLFRDGDMGLEEAITKMKADAMRMNANIGKRLDMMKALGENLSRLRQAMSWQREYDITTVKSMTDLAKILLDSGLLDDLSKYETKRILSAIKDAVGREDTSKQVQRLMDIMVDNQLRMGANYFGKLLRVKGSRVDARGIEVQGELDPDGQKIAQTVRRATTRTLDDIESMMAEAINRMGSADQALADEAALEYAGLQIAHQYVEEIRESKNEEKELRKSIDEYKAERKAEAEDSEKSIEQARVHKDAGRMTEHDFNLLVHDIEEEEKARWAAFKQYAEATNDAIRQNKIERADAYRSLSERLGGVLGESVERAKAWREAEKRRVEDIHHNANSDMEGRPANEHHKEDRLQKLVNNGMLRFVLAPLGTFDQMLRMFGRKNVRGEGYLWNRFMRGWVDCTEKEYTGYQEALKRLDKKVREIFAKAQTGDKKAMPKSWGDLFAMERGMPKATVSFRDGGEMREHELTQGNLLYIYMVDKMTDGRMKLRRMGITEADVEKIKRFVDPRFIELADWMQEEFLVDKRNEYNEVHKRMFGASMAAIENYFPLKILANARMENVDVADESPSDKPMPATSTGSIIKRRRNNLALDVTGADAFSVILDHIQQMERWAAFAEYNRDLNTLLSYKRFRNQVMNMTSAYGAGKTLWTNFRNVAALAVGTYRPPVELLDKYAVNVAKGVTAAKVSYRMFTALKQFLSMPAYVSDSNPIHLATNLMNPWKAWTWSMENLPLFEKRWKSRMAGDPRLLKSEMDWKMWRSRIVEIAGRVGMSPNAFVDAVTVAIGARSMYQTKLEKYKRQGYTPEQARKRALQDATILFNQTQQSSEGAFLSTMQVDRSWLSVLFTVFRNSSMSYTRQLYDAMRNIGHRLTPGYKGMTEEFMAKQMMRDGIDPDKATENAKREYRRGLIRDLVRVGIFGYALQLAWNLGAYLPYLIFGKDDQTKEEFWDDVWSHTRFGSIEGLTGGDAISNGLNYWIGSEEFEFNKLRQAMDKEMPIISDLEKLGNAPDGVSALNDVINLLVQSGLGFNPQSLTDAAVAVMDYCGEDAQTARECALLILRIINCPQSQIDILYFDEIEATGEEASTMAPEEIAERYAEYKLHMNAPLTGWAYDEEGRKKVKDKHRKKARSTMKERMTSALATQRTRELLENFDEVAEREKELRRLKKSDREAYREGMRQLREGTDMRRHNRVKRYNHNIKRLTEKWLNAKTPEEADSLARLMAGARERLLKEAGGIEAQ